MLTIYQQDSIPEWAYKSMMLNCPHCGAPIAQNENLTARWCPNRKCPGHMSFKLVKLADHFNIKGIGPATALQVIKSKGFTSHFDIMAYWFPEEKPRAKLFEIAALACIDGYGKTQAERDLASYGSFSDYFEKSDYVHPLLRQNSEILLKAETYFRVMPPLSDKFINVMGTGSFHGYQSRDEYFNLVNFIFGEYLHVIQVGKRKTGVAFLIKEKDAVDHSKSDIAAQYGIPVVTPLEFIQILCTHFHISSEEIRKKGDQLKQ